MPRCSRRYLRTSPGWRLPRVAGAAGRTRSTPTRPRTTTGAAAPCPAAGSECASPAAGWSPRSGWGATAGKQNARSPGCLAADGCGCAMTAARSGSLRSRCWPAPGFATTAASARAMRPVAPAFSAPECPMRHYSRRSQFLTLLYRSFRIGRVSSLRCDGLPAWRRFSCRSHDSRDGFSPTGRYPMTATASLRLDNPAVQVWIQRFTAGFASLPVRIPVAE
jgi:hypothetical protein